MSGSKAWDTRRKKYGRIGRSQYGGIPVSTPRGVVDGTLYCYGGCGLRYADFKRDVHLPTSLWNRIAVGFPFDEHQQGIDREGRGGVLCASCIFDRLAALLDCTVIYMDITGAVSPSVDMDALKPFLPPTGHVVDPPPTPYQSGAVSPAPSEPEEPGRQKKL